MLSACLFLTRTPGKKHLDHVQMNDFAGLGICLCGDAIGFAPGNITLCLELQHLPMKTVNIPVTHEDGIAHTCLLIPARSIPDRWLNLRLYKPCQTEDAQTLQAARERASHPGQSNPSLTLGKN